METRELLDRLIEMGVDVPVLAVEERPSRYIVTLQGGVILSIDKDPPDAGKPAPGQPTAGKPEAGTPAQAQAAELRPVVKKKPAARAVVIPAPDHPWKKPFKPQAAGKKK